MQKNYAGVLINALHPMSGPENDGQPTIRNQEAWELTRWLEEGVFGIPTLLNSSL